MPAFSLPALVVALVVSFSPAVVFQHSSPVPQLHVVPSLPLISLPMSLPMVPTIPMLDIHAALDALEGPFSLCNLPSPTVLFPNQFEYTLDVTKFIGTTCNDLFGTTWLSPLPSTSIPASPSHAVSALFLLVVVTFLLYALASPLHSLETISWPSSLIWPIPCRQPGTRLPHKQPSIVLPVDEAVTLPEQPGIILAADEAVPLPIPDTGSMGDKTHLDTPTPHHPTPRFPNRFAKVFRIIAFSSAPATPSVDTRLAERGIRGARDPCFGACIPG
ncbi:hypothetical protein DFH09DRAFT_1372612 [Mycena vulgaris]|nr:hypothetical protein DFH09DRAFT_1372612 [Mycena vulgaris]